MCFEVYKTNGEVIVDSIHLQLPCWRFTITRRRTFHCYIYGSSNMAVSSDHRAWAVRPKATSSGKRNIFIFMEPVRSIIFVQVINNILSCSTGVVQLHFFLRYEEGIFSKFNNIFMSWYLPHGRGPVSVFFLLHEEGIFLPTFNNFSSDEMDLSENISAKRQF